LENSDRNPANDGAFQWGTVVFFMPDGTVVRSKAEADAYALKKNPKLADVGVGADPDAGYVEPTGAAPVPSLVVKAEQP